MEIPYKIHLDWTHFKYYPNLEAECYDYLLNHYEAELKSDNLQILVNELILNPNYGLKRPLIQWEDFKTNYPHNISNPEFLRTCVSTVLLYIIKEENLNILTEDQWNTLLFNSKTNFLLDAIDVDELTIPASIEKLSHNSIYGLQNEKHSIKKIIVENGLKEIENDNFTACWGIEYIYIPKSVEKLGDSCFWYLKGTKEIHLPKKFEAQIVAEIQYEQRQLNPSQYESELPDINMFKFY